MMAAAVSKTLRRYRMLKNIRTLGVACSGGPDSTALLHVLVRFSGRHGIRLCVIHVHHGLRGRFSDLDETFCRNLAKSLKLPFVSGRIHVLREAKRRRLSLEEAARDLRYRFLIRTAKRRRLNAVALGHTQNDQAETVLMRIITGTGIQGLAGALPVFQREGIRFFRPLIELKKSEVLQFLRREKIRFRQDASNRSPKFLRNRIRHQLIPFLEKKFNPGIKKVLARIPDTVFADAQFLRQEAERRFRKLACVKGRSVLFPRPAFSKLPEAIQFRLIQLALKQVSRAGSAPAEFFFEHWQHVYELLVSGKPFVTSLPSGIWCRSSHAEIMFGNRIRVEKKKPGFQNGRLRLGGSVRFRPSRILIHASRLTRKPAMLKKKREDFAVIDADKVRFPLEIRNRQPGDYFQPLGQPLSIKLKNFLINRKVPQGKRDRVPLALSDGKIIWVGGVAVADPVKITDQTRHFAKLELISHPARK